jgi:glycosyltransferase involved in cell wall biosynthesis
MQQESRTPLIVHIVNAPMTLGFLTGQPAFLRDHGIASEVISPPGQGVAEFARREGIPVHAVAMSLRIELRADLLTLYRLWRLLRQLRPTIVHAHTTKAGVLGMAAAWLAGTPVRIYHLHGLPRMTAAGIRRVVYRWSDLLAFRAAHRVLCVSHSIRRAALDRRLFPPEKIRVPARGTINGLDAATRFNPALVGPDAGRAVRATLGIPPEAPVVGFVGRVVAEKGVVELAAAWRDLRSRYPELHLLIVGPIRPEDPIPPEVHSALAGDPRVRLAGWADDPRPYYAAMDILTLPSYCEGFPYALLEAAAMSLPVVATAVPGCVDAVVAGRTGALVPPRDAAALGGALAAYLDDPVRRRAHGRAGRKRVVRDFGQREVWEALLDEYRELLAARLGPLAQAPISSAVSSSPGSGSGHISDLPSGEPGPPPARRIVGLVQSNPLDGVTSPD